MPLTNAYCTLNELKAALRITDAVDDTLLENCINASSRLIDGYTNRHFYNAGTATRVYAAESALLVQTDDIAGTAITLRTASTEVGTYDTTFAVTDYQMEPLNRISEGQEWVFTRLRAVGDYLFPPLDDQAWVQVTAVFGWNAVPPQVTQATILQSARLFKRYDSPLGVAGFGDFGAVRVSRALDPDVAQLVDPFRRMDFLA